MEDSRARAARRRATWAAEVVTPGSPKELAYDEMTDEQRLRAFTDLNVRVWATFGLSLDPTPRADWPGQIFEIRTGD